MAKIKKTIKFAGREVPLTEAGLPNLVYLSKEERALVQAYAEKKRKAKQEILTKELQDILNNLG